MEDRIQTFCLLVLIILERRKSDAGEEDDGDDIDHGFQAHGDVSQAPGHVQKAAPGPPRTIAVATPAILPVPTREAVAIIRA